MHGVEKTADGGLRIGALTTIAEVAKHPMIKDEFGALSQGASEVASPQLRNQGTIGGNLCQKPRCWYYRGKFHCLRKGGDQCFAVDGENQFHCILGGDACFIVHPSDTAPTLIALGASVRIAGKDKMRTVDAENFHVLPEVDYTRETILDSHEVVTDIIIPPQPDGQYSTYRKVRARRSWDFSLSGVALAIKIADGWVERARVVFSGVAPVPWRSKEVEDTITGKQLNPDLAAKAGKAAVKDAYAMAKNGYKIALLQNVVTEELLKIEEKHS